MDKVEAEASAFADQGLTLVTTYGLKVVGAIAILVIGICVAGWAARATNRALDRLDRIDLTLRRFFASAARYLILVLTGLVVLSQFGVQTASLITLLGAAALAIGLALQGTLSSVAAGVMLLLFRPVRVGDYVEVAGHSGTVRAVTLFVTELDTSDNIHVVIPNAQVWGAAVKNYSYNDTRRCDLVIGVAYEADIDSAMAVINGVIAADDRAMGEPEPLVAVTALGDSAVEITVRVWSQASDLWSMRLDLIRNIKLALDAAGISIPYPQRTVHLVKDD